MRVIACGSRTFTDPRPINAVLSGLVVQGHRLTVINGGAAGADTIARQWAERSVLSDAETVRADWETHGKAAGPIRNQAMLDQHRPDLVVAFVDKPLAQSKGTADMVNRARKANVPTWVVEL